MPQARSAVMFVASPWLPAPTDSNEAGTSRRPGRPGTPVPVVLFAGSARIATGSYRCRYAGAMLLYPYLHRVGAQAIFATCTGGPARRYGDLSVLTTATVGFALGAGTVEGTKHLRRGEAGAALGLVMAPELATLRARLSALADNCDPLGLQRAFAAGMLAADPAAEAVYFVDDHFVPYAGARPVGRSARAGTPNAGTPNPGATTPCWSTPAAGRWSSARASRPGWCPPCPACSPSCGRYSARTPRSCWASTGAGPTRPRSRPAGTRARTGSPIDAPRWPPRPPRPGSRGPCATGDGSPWCWPTRASSSRDTATLDS